MQLRLRHLVKSPLILLVALTLVRGGLYLSIFPPFYAPDEAAHFEAIRLLGQERQWPTRQVYQTTPMHPQMTVVFDQFKIWEMVGLYSPTKNLGQTDNLFIHYYPTQISASAVVADSYLMLYHVLLAPLAGLLAPLPLAAQVYLLRLVSVGMAAAAVAMAWITARTIFPADKSVALGAAGFMVLWPMHTHVTAAINTDTLAELIGSLFFAVLALVFMKGATTRRVAALAGLAALAFITKPTLFFLLPALVAAAFIYWGRRRGWSVWFMGGALAGLTALLPAAAVGVFANTGGGRRLLAVLSQGFRWPAWGDFFTSQALTYYAGSLNFAVLSFAGLFGWSNLHIPWGWVRVWAVVLAVMLAGVLLFVGRDVLPRGGPLTPAQKTVLVAFGAALLFSIMSVTIPVVVTQSRSWGIHSRYYFPAIVPLALFLYLGARHLAPARFRARFWRVWLAGWALYDLAVLVLVILPFLFS